MKPRRPSVNRQPISQLGQCGTEGIRPGIAMIIRPTRQQRCVRAYSPRRKRRQIAFILQATTLSHVASPYIPYQQVLYAVCDDEDKRAARTTKIWVEKKQPSISLRSVTDRRCSSRSYTGGGGPDMGQKRPTAPVRKKKKQPSII